WSVSQRGSAVALGLPSFPTRRSSDLARSPRLPPRGSGPAMGQGPPLPLGPHARVCRARPYALNCRQRTIRRRAMLGLMQDWPLTVDRILDHAKTNFSRREVVTRGIESGVISRSNYGTIWRRAKQVTNALRERGVQLGDRVATLAWNSERHME